MMQHIKRKAEHSEKGQTQFTFTNKCNTMPKTTQAVTRAIRENGSACRKGSSLGNVSAIF